jgi:hypothetical protein
MLSGIMFKQASSPRSGKAALRRDDCSSHPVRSPQSRCGALRSRRSPFRRLSVLETRRSFGRRGVSRDTRRSLQRRGEIPRDEAKTQRRSDLPFGEANQDNPRRFLGRRGVSRDARRSFRRRGEISGDEAISPETRRLQGYEAMFPETRRNPHRQPVARKIASSLGTSPRLQGDGSDGDLRSVLGRHLRASESTSDPPRDVLQRTAARRHGQGVSRPAGRRCSQSVPDSTRCRGSAGNGPQLFRRA